MRALCERCRRPQVACVCRALPRIENRTPVLILQHPRESRHPWGTVPLLTETLTNRVVRVGVEHAVESGTVLSPTGAPLDPSRLPERLIVLDGTWSGATQIRRANPWLERCPAVRVVADGGRYRTRSEPVTDGLSTVEAVAMALASYEPHLAESLARLLDAFALRESQLVDARQEHPRRRTRRRGWSRLFAARPTTAVVSSASYQGRLFAVATRVRGRTDVFAIEHHNVTPAQRSRVHDPSCPMVDLSAAHERIATLLGDAEVVFSWRAAPLSVLRLSLPIYDLKTLYRTQPDAVPGAVTTIVDGAGSTRLVRELDASARLLDRLSERFVHAEERGGEPE